jgi:hypothetical protein
MGYKPTVYNLVFDDLDGLEVRAHGTSVGQVKKFMTFKEGGRSAEQVEELIAAFSKALISWNLEDDGGQPVPATAEGIDDFPDSNLVLAIVNAWVETVTGVDGDLGKDLPSGRQFPEASLPMETLSASLVS